MPNPVVALTGRLEAAIEAALGHDFAGTDPVLRRSASPQFGDFQANAAMGLGKRVGRAPREVAAQVVAALDVADLCADVEVAGPGFINLRLRDDVLAAAAADLLADDRLGVPPSPRPERVVVDYSAPNVAKEMHVGHLRATIIGDTLARVLAFAGHEVIRQNHLGDWGTPFGMLIEHLLDVGEEEAVRELSVGELTSFYQQARAKFDGEEGFADRSRARVVLLQGGDDRTLRLWRLLFDASKSYFNAVYAQLGVLLTDDDIAAESFYNPWLAETAAELEDRGIARIDDGALCAFPAGFTGRDGQPMALIIRKRDGGYGYQATDLAAVRYRTATLHADRIIYVVGTPQSQHLAMVHQVGREAGWLAPAGEPGPRAEHVAFGSVLGPDRRMLKTRSGDTVKLSGLLDEAVDRAAAKVADANPDLDAGARRVVAAEVGIGAVKYADLANDRVKDYVFDWDRMLAFEGNSGPYLQYAHARVRSIFRRGEITDTAFLVGVPVNVAEDTERQLVLKLLELAAVVDAVVETLQPHRLCTYLFEVAQAFTAFFEQCPVLRAPDEATRTSRLALCELTARTIATGLDLLGIAAPDRM